MGLGTPQIQRIRTRRTLGRFQGTQEPRAWRGLEKMGTQKVPSGSQKGPGQDLIEGVQEEELTPKLWTLVVHFDFSGTNQFCWRKGGPHHARPLLSGSRSG